MMTSPESSLTALQRIQMNNDKDLNMKIIKLIAAGFALIILSGCTSAPQNQSSTKTASSSIAPVNESEDNAADSYRQISQETAKEMMNADDGHIIIDVRRQDEFDSGHIEGAICIPNESIDTEQPPELPDLDQIILVYCRSGRRSKEAAQKLYDMGYTNVYEFGGIIDWIYGTVTN